MSEDTKAQIIWGLAIVGGIAGLIVDKNDSGEWDFATLFAAGFVSLFAAWGLVSIIDKLIGPPATSSVSPPVHPRPHPARSSSSSTPIPSNVSSGQLEALKEQRRRNLEALAKELAAATVSGDVARKTGIEFLSECTRGDLQVLDLPPQDMKWLVEFSSKEVFPWYRYWTGIASAGGNDQPALWDVCVAAYGLGASADARERVNDAMARGVDYWTAAGSNIPVSPAGRRAMEDRFSGSAERFIKACWFMTDQTAKGDGRG